MAKKKEEEEVIAPTDIKINNPTPPQRTISEVEELKAELAARKLNPSQDVKEITSGAKIDTLRKLPTSQVSLEAQANQQQAQAQQKSIEQVQLELNQTQMPTLDERAEQIKKEEALTPTISARGINIPPQLVGQSLARAWDIVHSAVTGKDAKSVTIAQQTFNDQVTTIGLQIQAVRQGEDPTNVIRTIQQAERGINRLEQLSKGEAQLNLKYQLDQGAALQADIIREREILAELKRNLIIASTQPTQTTQTTQ